MAAAKRALLPHDLVPPTHHEFMSFNILDMFQSIVVIFIDVQFVHLELVGTSSGWFRIPFDITEVVFDTVLAFQL